jgi:hypothetical protein
MNVSTAMFKSPDKIGSNLSLRAAFPVAAINKISRKAKVFFMLSSRFSYLE